MLFTYLSYHIFMIFSFFSASMSSFVPWFQFFLHFCCLINLLRYLEAGAGARAGTGAGAAAGAGAEVGAGSGAGAGINNLYEDWLSPPCGVWVETCHQLNSEKEENYLNLGPKQYLPSFSDRHWSTNMLSRETEEYTGSCALICYDFLTNCFLPKFDYMWHTQTYFF